jgi:hypothetical protein
MTNPTPQPASEPKEWRAEQRADGWWTLLTNSTILAFGLDTATKDTILAEHVQAARTRELEEALRTAHQHMDDQNARGTATQCYWCGSKGYDANGLTHIDACPIIVMRRALASHRTAQEEGQ